MEASMGTDAPQQDTGQQDAGQETQSVPPEIGERLNELSQRFDQFEPVLGQLGEALQQPGEEPQQEEEPQGVENFVDPETGYVLDPDGLQQFITQQAERLAGEKYGPLEQRLTQFEQERADEALDALAEQYPQLQDEKFAAPFANHVKALAAEGGHPELAQQDWFVEMVYLAGQASEQAQQGVPAGGQNEVHLEGGSGNPGQPETNPTLERFRGWAQEGASSGPWGKSLDQL